MNGAALRPPLVTLTVNTVTDLLTHLALAVRNADSEAQNMLLKMAVAICFIYTRLAKKHRVPPFLEEFIYNTNVPF